MSDFRGQWLGKSVGDPSGTVVLDLEKVGQNSVGLAYLYCDKAGLPPIAAAISIPNSSTSYKFEGKIVAFDSRVGKIFTYRDLEESFPEIKISEKAQFELTRRSATEITIKWSTDIGTYGETDLILSSLGSHSAVIAEKSIDTWQKFKEHVSKFSFRNNIFRGQSQPFPLQTTFHRTNRKVLSSYLEKDVQELHRSITGKIDHLFDLTKPVELGAFLNLAQHHGFPTPLLDWTYSPFVAAWFAFSTISKKPEPRSKSQNI